MKQKGMIFFLLLMVVIGFTVPTYGARQLYKVAVLPFDDRSIQNRWWGNQFDVGQEVSSELVTALMNTNQFRLIEREEVDRVLGEQKWSAVNVDSNTAIEFGKMLGVNFLVMGHVTEFSLDSQGSAFVDPRSSLGLAFRTKTARVSIDARMVDTTTAEILWGVTGVGEKKRTDLGLASGGGAMMLGGNFAKSDLGQAMRDAVASVATQFAQKSYESSADKPIEGLVAYTSPGTIIINVGSDNGVEPGMTFMVRGNTQTVRDPVTKEVIAELGDDVAVLTVVEVKEKASICRIESQKGDIAVNAKVKSKVEPRPAPVTTPTPASKSKKKSNSNGNASDWL
ncbi:MAG TPA: hypothetical protein DDW50_06615 [Firmicutes bacterium]|nr:hypothetical protein [Bacillota bacterium]